MFVVTNPVAAALGLCEILGLAAEATTRFVSILLCRCYHVLLLHRKVQRSAASSLANC